MSNNLSTNVTQTVNFLLIWMLFPNPAVIITDDAGKEENTQSKTER